MSSKWNWYRCPYPEDKFITTPIIPELKVLDVNGTELQGYEAHFLGVESEVFQLHLVDISEDLMQSEFKHHFDAYYKK
ncbi:hypothetical protein SAMN05216480_102256 [Pustulibacterium marinum]|uniref:Uncharacterized protein n=1 Tax=Pustulibacterium marinum TaxID=1224947 RepID=A0A1I7FUS3_9FLAO|nr:hypothetical protein SAMN05216480_102256 [Pustulibacterium marinum]